MNGLGVSVIVFKNGISVVGDVKFDDAGNIKVIDGYKISYTNDGNMFIGKFLPEIAGDVLEFGVDSVLSYGHPDEFLLETYNEVLNHVDLDGKIPFDTPRQPTETLH